MDERPSFARRVGSALGVRAGEGRRTTLLFVQLLLASGIFTLGRTVRDTLFLSRYPLSALPWMFVFYGVASALTTVLYARYADKLPRHVALLGSVSVGAATYLLVWVLVRAQIHLVYPVFYVWSEVAANLFIVQFWTQANDLHDPRSAKRLFGTIGAARVLGVVVIGVTSGAVVRAVGTAQLLFVLVAMMAGVGALGVALAREPRPEAEPPRAEKARREPVSRDPYVRALAAFLLLTFVALTIGDYQFKAIARATYREDELAQFFSLFYAATGIVSFLFQILATPRILRRLGVGWGMSVMPGVFGTASVLLPFWPNLAVASCLKFADNGFQYTIHETTLQALYVPFPARAKARTRALLDAVVKPCSYGAGGLVLILLATRLPVEKLGFVSSAIVLLWLVSIPIVRRRYLASLEATLTLRGTLLVDADFVLDAASRKALIEVLERDNPRQVLVALEQLAGDESPELAAALGRLVASPSSEVRSAALARLATLPGGNLGPAANALADADPRVRAAAARAYAKVARDDAVDALTPLLTDDATDVRVATTAGLVLHAGVEGSITGGARLEQLMDSSDPDDRIEAASVLGEIGPSAYRPLRTLLSDPHAAVRRAALRASETVADPRLVPVLIEMLRDAPVRLRASNALVAVGQASLEPLLGVMENPTEPRAVRLFVPRILRRIPALATYERLRERAGVGDSHLRLRILAALSSLRHSLALPAEPIDVVRQLLRVELVRGYRNLGGWDQARERYETPLLAEEMSFRHLRAIRRILRVLELRYDPAPLRLVRQRLEDRSRRANALEVLDTLLEPSLRPMVLHFLDDLPVRELLAKGGALVPPIPAPREFMREEAEHPNPYVSLVALDALGRAGDPIAAEVGREACSRAEPLAREGGLFAVCAVDPDAAQRLLPSLLNDPDPVVAHHARGELARLTHGELGEVTMHSTVEKITYLKSAPLFAKVTGEDLGPLAHVAEEETFGAGSHIVEEGETGESLYVIVRGKVAIEHDGEVVATLGAGEAFGEMAVLDNAPRSASAVALEETELLRIGSQEFYEILHEQVEIAVGVIRMLTQRLREATQNT